MIQITLETETIIRSIRENARFYMYIRFAIFYENIKLLIISHHNNHVTFFSFGSG